MKSVKPGRGPSAMGAVGAVVGVVFGIIWTVAAVSMGAPIFFPLFGLVFITIGIVQAVYNFINATGENRYSEYDIVDENEEPDPLNRRFSASSAPQAPSQEAHGGPSEPLALLPLLRRRGGRWLRLLRQVRQKTPRHPLRRTFLYENRPSAGYALRIPRRRRIFPHAL